MDYDENDFQSQNFHLVGEDKFSTNLRPFALPKFDLDEHLRFDSLVEEEVLLGIQGQESNWIDFPSGNNAIEFSSSVVESCSIARHKNVWSEATSSESVDLLLKSVGEDEMINNKAIIMETCANDESYVIDNQVNIFAEKDNEEKSYIINVLPVDPKLGNLSGLNGGQREILTNVHGSSYTTEGEDSRIAMHVDHSNRRFNSDGEIGDNATSFYNSIEKSKADEDGLCQEVLNKKGVCDVLMRTEALDSDSSLLDSQSLESNQDAELVMEKEKLSTGVFSGGQHQRYISNSSAFLCDDAQNEKSFVIANHHLMSKTDALGLLNRKSIYSEFSENSDELVEAISYQTKYLDGNSEMCDKLFVKGECTNQSEMVQDDKIENDSVIISSKAIPKTTQLTERYRNVGDMLPFDSVEDDDDLHGIRTQLIKNSMISCDDKGGKNDTCIDIIVDKQYPLGHLVENKSNDVENGTQILTELPTSIHINYEAQGIKIEDCEMVSTNLLSLTCENSGLAVEGNPVKDMVVERQDNFDEDKDPPGESPLPIALTDVSTLPVVDSKSMTSPSTYCKSSVSKTPISDTDISEALMSEVGGSVDKVSSLTYRDPGRIQDSAEGLSLDVSANILVEELGKKEPLITILSSPNINQDDGKDVKISSLTAPSLSTTHLVSEKGSALASVSHPLNIKETSPENVLQCDSDTSLNFPVKSPDSQLSQDTAVLNLAIEQKEPSCLAPSDSFFSEGNELKFSDGVMLSNSKKKGDKVTANGIATGSDCLEDAILTKHFSNTVMQPPSPVRSIDFTLPQNDVSSSVGNAFGNAKSLLLGGNDICHGPQEGKDDNLNPLEVVSCARNEVSGTASGKHDMHISSPIEKVFSCKSPRNEQCDQYKLGERDVSDVQNLSAQTGDNLNSHMKDSSQICTGTTVESNSSKAQSGNSSYFEHNCDLPIVINGSGCQLDNSEQQELKALGNVNSVSSDKDEITCKVIESNTGLHTTSVEDKVFSFGVSTIKDLPEKDNCNELPLLNLKAIDTQMPKENSLGLPDEVKVFDSLTQTPIQGKPKNASRPEKKTSSKGKIKKDARALKQSSVMDVKCSSSTHKSVGNLSKDKPLVEIREKPSIECSAKKASPSLDAQTSSIPDLNSSSSLGLSHHNFTDLQQVQLRAQIFVYGALISGTPPDEAYMVSAFGGTDGGRNLWHGLWHLSIERFQNQKSPLSGYDTPSHSRPAIWIPEHVSIGNDVQSKTPTTCATKSSNIIISSSVLSSTVSLPSPLWSLSYGNDGHHAGVSRGSYMNFSQTPSSLPRQSFVSRQHVGANSSWLSQSPRPVPWFFSSQISALDGIPQYSTIPVTETVHVTPVKDSCGSHTPTFEIAPHRVLMHAPDTAANNTAAVLQVETSKGAGNIVNNKFTPATQKARKRKKSTTAEELSLPVSKILAESVSAPSAFKNPALPPASMLLSSNSQISKSQSPVSVSTPQIISPSHYQMIGANYNQQISILYEETCSKVEQAKLHAEEAATFAASTVKYSQGIWSQLAAHKNSGVVSDIEEKLASAAAATAAAASVAKAAAAAANVASAAALQAKIMADEAMGATRTVNTVFNPESDIHDVGKRLAGITPASILKGMDKIHGSGAVISAASEATRRRVESASAATIRAKNLDAIVKAAELAAEAVTQAGTIIAMGDPLPFTLRELVDSGSEGFWRGHDSTSMKLSEPSYRHVEEHGGLNSAKVHGVSAKQLPDQFLNDKETQKATGDGDSLSLNECYKQFQGNAQGNFFSSGPEADQVFLSSLQKGSVVEVMSDEDGLKGAWFSARVLEVVDNKAYVCYSDVSNTEGKLKEWIVLENGEKAPRIRTAHSLTSVKYEGTRKRRRAQLGSYSWQVGDHVDAWIHDRWWEGTIMEKIPGNEMKLTVHFPATGEKQVVNAWNLRLSLIWKDGQWMERSHAKGNSFNLQEGDTPQEKRQKLGRLEEKNHLDVDAAGAGKLSKNILIEESRKPDDSRSLLLSAKDRTFSIGKNSSEQVTSHALKQKRTGLQKEGSRVVFGVPRPGKKRKFMEVSKHYVANKPVKINEGNDSIKFAKYLMPQTSRQSKNTSKVDSKGKKNVQINTRGGIKAVNSQSFQIRSMADVDKASLSASNEETDLVYHKEAIPSFKSNSNCLDKMNTFKFSSLSNQAEKKNVSAVESDQSMQPAPATFSKKKTTLGSESDLVVKQTSSTNRTSAVEDKGLGNSGKPIHEVTEPRRSNRRIQPTSRLLEGLQSSLVISKVPSVSHERKPPRGGSSSRGNMRG